MGMSIRAPLALLSFCLLLPLTSMAASPEGRWQTIDDETGQARSIVEITRGTDGSLNGKVVKILQSDKGPNPLCEKCSGSRQGQPITGMTILWGLTRDGEHWSGGQILDPAKGKTYKARLTPQADGSLEVRGFIGIEALGRSQLWQPAASGAGEP